MHSEEDKTPTERSIPVADEVPTQSEALLDLVSFVDLAETAFGESRKFFTDTDKQLAEKCKNAQIACAELLSYVGQRTCEPAIRLSLERKS
jgi:hypothetical protein